MDVILATVKGQYTLVYNDDTTTLSKTLKKHPQHFEKVQKLFNNAGMTVEIKKCSFFCKTIEYLRHVIASGKLQVAAWNTKASTVL